MCESPIRFWLKCNKNLLVKCASFCKSSLVLKRGTKFTVTFLVSCLLANTCNSKRYVPRYVRLFICKMYCCLVSFFLRKDLRRFQTLVSAFSRMLHVLMKIKSAGLDNFQPDSTEGFQIPDFSNPDFERGRI